MNTVDSLLAPIFREIKNLETGINSKDKKILVSLYKQVNCGVFLTENQSNLLVKILKENLKAIKPVLSEIDATLVSNHWSQPFRQIRKIRKIYLSEGFDNVFFVEFNYNAKLRDKMSQLHIKMKGTVPVTSTKYAICLNETNLHEVLVTFSKDNFEIDEKLANFNLEIENIRKTTSSPFEIFSTTHEKLKKSVADDITDISTDNVLLLQDRKIRYQYEILEKTEDFTLAAKIAHRTGRKIFVNSDIHSLSEVINSLIELNRLPLLMVFDGHSSLKDKKSLNLVENALTSCKNTEHVGIYYRYDKSEDKENFNQEIARLGYNKNLSEDTVVAGISNTKLPKFMIKNEWKPETVISFTNSFKSNKTYVYCNEVDLIIYYGNIPPLDKDVHALM
jgi:hypothetical protein